MRKIPILVLVKASYRISDMIHFAGELNRDGQFIFHMVIDDRTGVHSKELDERQDIHFIDQAPRVAQSGTASGFNRKKRVRKALSDLVSMALGLLKNRTFVQLIREKKKLNELLGYYSKAVREMSEIRPKLVVTIGDRHYGFEQPYLKAAREMKIPIIIPYLVHSSKEAALKYRKENLKHYSLTVFSSLYTRKTFKAHKNTLYKQKIFYPPVELRALSKFGTLPADPWTMGTGISDIVCVDSLFTRNRYTDEGVASSKLRIMGDLSYDRLYYAFKNKRRIQNECQSKYNLDEKKKNIIVSLPQLGEHNLLSWESHWKEIHFLCRTLAKTDANILISLHPRMDPTQYAFLSEEYGFNIMAERLYGTLTAADVFVATFSSTVVWAVLCGIPSVVIDFYGFNYKMFDHLSTVRIVKEKEKLLSELSVSASGASDFENDWECLSRAETFHGNVLNNYRKLILDSVAARHP